MNFSRQIIAVLKEAKSLFFDKNQNHFETLDLKGLNQLVTNIDVAVEQFLVTEFLKIIPDSSFIAEENTAPSTISEYRWIIDPVDGTTNFVHKVPAYAISVALQKNEKTIAGFVYEITRDELFWADENTSAMLNDKPISVTNTALFEDTLMATGFPYYEFEKLPEYIKVLEFCMKNTRGVRRLGSAATDLAYVACGRFDGFFEVGLSPWDVAAGAYIVQRAGGEVFDFKDGDNYIFGGQIVAGNAHITKQLSMKIRTYFGEWV
ncbi:MAG: inositol monophosphatase [Flavobacteriales bacterium]|nr:inositol monophosphatase [Flavobacteriales bacterium]